MSTGEAGSNWTTMSQMRKGLLAMKNGDFAFRLPEDGGGPDREMAIAFNGIAALNQELADRLQNVDDPHPQPGVRRSLKRILGEVVQCAQEA